MTAHPETGRKEFTITRAYDAPRELVWRAFADGEALAQWWGPKGFTMTVLGFEFRPGGTFHYRMDGPSGFTMWARFIYREIAEPDRIVFVNSFSDEAGSLSRAPFFDGTWPLEVLTTIALSEQAGTTTVTLRSHPINANDIEQATFESNLESMSQGFGNAFDQLAAYLARPGANT